MARKPKATNSDGVTVVTSKSGGRFRKRTLIKIAIIVVVLAAAGGTAWWYTHRSKPLTKMQQGVEKALPAQEQFLQQQKQSKVPDGSQSITYANLAVSYAVIDKCKQAQDALKQAQDLATTPDLQQNVKDAKTTVDSHCR